MRLKGFYQSHKRLSEVANFDTQKILNPCIHGLEYQNGAQKDFYNLREYILYRDGQQNAKTQIARTVVKTLFYNSIILYLKVTGGPDAPNNLITITHKMSYS